MVAIGYNGSEIDHCHRCGGVLVEPGEGEAHFSEWAEPSSWMGQLAQQTTQQWARCPVDGGKMVGYRVPYALREVIIDHCEDCGALWFDAGEAQKLTEIVKAAERDGYFDSAAGAKRTDAVDIVHSNTLAAEQDRMPKPGVSTYVFQLFTGMPVEVWNPVHGKPVIVPILTALIVLIFGAEMAYLLSVSEPERDAFMRMWGLVPELVFQGKNLWTIVTYGFLHGGLLHIAGNAYFLWVFGDNVEDRVGKGPFLLVYGLSLFVAAALQMIYQSDPSVPLIGASGAIAGLMGAYLMLFPRVKLWMVFFFIQWRVPVVVYFGFWLLLQFILGALDVPGVGWWAHAGGFVTGLVLGAFLRDVPHPLAPGEEAIFNRFR